MTSEQAAWAFPCSRPYRFGDVLRRSACGTYDSGGASALTATGFFSADAPRAPLAVREPNVPAPRQPRLLDRVGALRNPARDILGLCIPAVDRRPS